MHFSLGQGEENLLHMSFVSANTEDYNYVLMLIQLLQIPCCKAHCENVSDNINHFINWIQHYWKELMFPNTVTKPPNNKNNFLNEAASYSDLVGEKDKQPGQNQILHVCCIVYVGAGSVLILEIIIYL